MKELVKGECGGSNQLVRLSNNFAQSSNARIQSGLSSTLNRLMPTTSKGDELANEFLASRSQQVQMPGTFKMEDLLSTLPQQHNRQAAHRMGNSWANEFSKNAPLGQQFANEFIRVQRHRDVAHDPSIGTSHQWAGEFLEGNRGAMEAAWNDALQGAKSGEPHGMMWSSEYLDRFEDKFALKDDDVAREWFDEFIDTKSKVSEGETFNYDEFQRFLEERDLAAASVEKNNPFLGSHNLVADGQQRMMEGDLSNAILCFEAAVQENPRDAQIWYQLGQSHAENEDDPKAISAYMEALKIHPNHQDALLGLSVSYANESKENDALTQLELWLHAFTGNDRAPTPMPMYSSFLDQTRFKQVEERFLNTARQQMGGQVNDKLQNAMGVLYNLNRNFDRAVDCIQAALSVKPDDARLWNRLGATMANGDRTTDAIAAYRQALQLYPTYVRARYNLGISCMHLSSHREAAGHFLSALHLQKKPEQSNIWTTMRSAVLRMNDAPEDLLRAIDNRDLDGFTRIFRSA
ncbi:hypothetical protein L596_006567 [Steinernema carpocapsae]|uniref:Uncharacterized protein n=1 Tax=Steinernema carpocapsae TaxID=34508 RepID=A0A4U8VBB1_STECR|nr:hypothetical protein L596_006567 [Steinernema carpocapsae]